MGSFYGGCVFNEEQMKPVKKLKCSLCDDEFPTKKRLKKHMKHHQMNIDLETKDRLNRERPQTY